MLEKSYVYGPIFLILFFLLCLIIVVGVKVIILSLKQKVSASTADEPVKSSPLHVQKRKKRQVRTIEINPDEINRICFKKTS